MNVGVMEPRDGAVPFDGRVGEVASSERPLTAALEREGSSDPDADVLNTQFVASVSHELRTPLTAICAALGLLAMGTAGALPAPAAAVVQVAQRNAMRLLRLVDDLLDLQRLQHGGLAIARTAFAVDEVIAQSVEALGILAGQAGVTVRTVRCGCAACGDPCRVMQVLVNLLANALKVAPAGSAVDVEAESEDGYVRISVRDRGPGVPAALGDAVFQPFVQAAPNRAGERGSAGLGLPICRSIVRRHGGRIGTANHADGGATFWFTLPLAAEASVPAAAAPGQP